MMKDLNKGVPKTFHEGETDTQTELFSTDILATFVPFYFLFFKTFLKLLYTFLSVHTI